MTASFRINDDDIRAIYNSAVEGTATDAIVRHACRVALAERCIGCADPRKKRYPSTTEQAAAREQLARGIRQGNFKRAVL
jgi:hypothetical protein